jgi:hypothetical protein
VCTSCFETLRRDDKAMPPAVRSVTASARGCASTAERNIPMAPRARADVVMMTVIPHPSDDGASHARQDGRQDIEDKAHHQTAALFYSTGTGTSTSTS